MALLDKRMPDLTHTERQTALRRLREWNAWDRRTVVTPERPLYR